MKHRTFIIGNGFDMDLGLHTSYQDFVNSDLWPITNSDLERSSLADKLEKDKKENWFNLEDSLCEYAQARPAHSELNLIKLGSYMIWMFTAKLKTRCSHSLETISLFNQRRILWQQMC